MALYLTAFACIRTRTWCDAHHLEDGNEEKPHRLSKITFARFCHNDCFGSLCIEMIFVTNGRQNHLRWTSVCCWHKCKTIKQHTHAHAHAHAQNASGEAIFLMQWHTLKCIHGLVLISIVVFYYPRPVLAFEYCWRLRRCVCQSVCQSLAFLCDNSGPVQARIIKFGTKMQNNLVKGICGAIDLDLQGET